MRRTVVLAALIAFAVTACGDDGASPGGSDPFGFTTVDMPASEPAIRAVFDRMPGQVAGLPRVAGGGTDLVVLYGDDSGIVAFPFVDDGGSGAPESLTQDLSQFQLEAGAVVESSGLDPSSDMVWVVGSFTDSVGTVHLAVWGDPAGTWVFNASSTSSEFRDAIVEAFIAAI